MGTKFVRNDEKFWKWILMMVLQHCKCLNTIECPLNWTLKCGYDDEFHITYISPQ